MNAIEVELTGTSPMLHNRLWSDGSGWVPKDDMEQAESRLFGYLGMHYLPWDRPSIAVGRAAWSKHQWRGARWPRDVKHAEAARDAVHAVRVDFHGDWKPQVFLRHGLEPVALPRFDAWSATFTLRYDPHYYEADQLRELLEFSGRRLGLPVFAPFAGPGPWGLFSVERWEPVCVGRLEEAVV